MLGSPASERRGSSGRTYVRRLTSVSGMPHPSGTNHGRTSTFVNGVTESQAQPSYVSTDTPRRQAGRDDLWVDRPVREADVPPANVEWDDHPGSA